MCTYLFSKTFCRCILFALSFFSFTFLQAQQKENYSRVKVLLNNEYDMFRLSALGVAADHGDYRKGQYFVSDFSETEINTIKNAGFKTIILIDDVVKYYVEQNNKPRKDAQHKMSSVPCDTTAMQQVQVPSHFHPGSYGGYFTYNEMLDMLDSMALLYPNLISTSQPIHNFKTAENRSIYWVRISNNPSTDQTGKPEMFYNSLIHAREPGSLSSMIFTMWYLLENYNKDPQVKAIVDNTELYFVPCINPDGYIYNNINDPNGGGLWRKNRRQNADFSYGVDLNRNFGQNWGYDNIGSSPNGYDQTYRGTSAFSEPETQAIKWFCENHDFDLTLNYHTYNNELLFPWSHEPVFYTPDSLQYTAYSRFVTQHNFYRYGTCFQCLGYVSNGSVDDWMYGDISTKNKIFAWTPEIGHVQYGFYPPASEIIPDCKRNLLANINAASLLLPYAKINTGDPNILIEKSGYLHYSLQSLGVQQGSFTVTILPLDNWLTVPSPTKSYNNINLLEIVNDSISYALDPSTPNNQAIRYALKVNNQHYDLTDTIEFFFGKFNSVYTPIINNLNTWSNTGWNIDNAIYYSAPSSVKSGPLNGNYPDNTALILQSKDTIDLTTSARAYLQFYCKWDIEPKYDYLTIDVAEVGSTSWQSLCGRYTKPGDYGQPIDAPIYDNQQYDWLLEQMDLNPFLGKKVNVRFVLVSDQAANYKGFHFDDLRITTVEDSAKNIRNIGGTPAPIIYPNPAYDRLTIELNSVSGVPMHAVLYNSMGVIVKDVNITSYKTEIDVRSLPTNIYYIKIYNKDLALPVQKVELLK